MSSGGFAERSPDDERPETMARSTARGPRMPKIDDSRPFIPVRIAVLTVSDTRGAGDDKSGDTLAEMIAAAGHEVAGRAIVKDDVAADQRQGAGLDCRSGGRRRDHHGRHRLHRPRRDAGGRQAAVREGDRRLLDGLSHDLVRRRWRPRQSSPAPAPASRGAPTSSACRARPAPAGTPGTTSCAGSSTTATGPAISSRSCPARGAPAAYALRQRRRSSAGRWRGRSLSATPTTAWLSLDIARAAGPAESDTKSGEAGVLR